MGTSSSTPERPIYCDNHCSKKATGFCLSHKTLICMSCIAGKVHFGIDCNIKETEFMSSAVKECFLMKQDIMASKKAMTEDQKQRKMFTEIDKRYDTAMDNLQKLKQAHLEVARQEIRCLFTNETETLDKLYQVVDLYYAGQNEDANKLKNQLRRETFGYELVSKEIDPAFHAIWISLTEAEECIPAVPEEILSQEEAEECKPAVSEEILPQEKAEECKPAVLEEILPQEEVEECKPAVPEEILPQEASGLEVNNQ